MRPRLRFSLKWMLIGFTVLSVTFYFFFVRPTAIAQDYLDKVQSGDISDIQLLYRDNKRLAHHLSLWRFEGDFPTKDSRVQGRLERRTWKDFWTLQRRVNVYFELPKEVGLPVGEIGGVSGPIVGGKLQPDFSAK